jgi:uncharacterized protein YbaR (Trm112 family)
MGVNPDLGRLVEFLACPMCQNRLLLEPLQLRCDDCGRAYELNGRVPALLLDDPGSSEPSRLARLQYAILGNPRVYDLHQKYGGGREIAAHVGRTLLDVRGATLLDIGAGTGMVAGLVPSATAYIWLDNDRLKLRGLLTKSIDCYAVLGDGARLPIATKAVDRATMVEVSHHLSDALLENCLSEAARVTRGALVFVDALRGPRRRSKLLWKLDLGRFPRTEDELVSAIDRRFEVTRLERFRVNHDHLLCVGVPRPATSLGAAA